MAIIVRLITVLTNSFVFLTCGTIVEGIRLLVSSQLARSNVKSSLMLSVSLPIICIMITVALISFTDYLSLNGKS